MDMTNLFSSAHRGGNIIFYRCGSEAEMRILLRCVASTVEAGYLEAFSMGQLIL